MTVADAPTMPLNCLIAGAPVAGDPFGPGAGAMFVLVVCDIFGATRREPDPSSVIGLARVRVARHSEPSLTICLRSIGEANVCTPRPTSSRVITADGRSPGSRVDTLRRLPRTEIPSGT